MHSGVSSPVEESGESVDPTAPVLPPGSAVLVALVIAPLVPVSLIEDGSVALFVAPASALLVAESVAEPDTSPVVISPDDPAGPVLVAMSPRPELPPPVTPSPPSAKAGLLLQQAPVTRLQKISGTTEFTSLRGIDPGDRVPAAGKTLRRGWADPSARD